MKAEELRDTLYGTDEKDSELSKLISESGIPVHLWPGLKSWVRYGHPPGGFLQAILANNGREAICRADQASLTLSNLQSIVKFLFNHAPAPSWGSPEALWDWCDERFRHSIEPHARKK